MRYLSITLLTGMIVLSIFSVQFMGFVMILVIIFTLVGLISIRFPFLYVFQDYFVIEYKGIVKRLSDRETYRYDEIKKIEFISGYIKSEQLLGQAITGTGAYGGFSKPDQMMLSLFNDKVKIIYRFGSRKAFKDVIHKLQSYINKK